MALGPGKVKYTVIFDKPVYQVLERIAKQEDRKVTYIVNRLCREACEARGLLPKDADS